MLGPYQGGGRPSGSGNVRWIVSRRKPGKKSNASNNGKILASKDSEPESQTDIQQGPLEMEKLETRSARDMIVTMCMEMQVSIQ